MPKILNEVYNTRLKIVESTETEPGVLATVAGTFAEPTIRNKNGRLYGLAPWHHALDEDEDVQRSLNFKLMYGELDHPEDYLEVKIEKTAICTTKLQINEAKGIIEGEAKVLDTPAGHLLHTLIKFGSVLGVSSRASGELDANGNVIPETFRFITFDIVTNPSNAGALPTLRESTEEPTKSLKDILLESIANADLNQLKIITDMSSTLEQEMATEVINKVEERKAELLKEQAGDPDEQIKVLTEKVDQLTVLVNDFANYMKSAISVPKQSELETPVVESVNPHEEVAPVVETSTRAKPRMRKNLNENTRTETTVSVVRVNSTTEINDSTERRVEHLVKTHRSK